MANKVKTRFDSAAPNKNKVAVLVGVNKQETVYVDFLELKVEKNGIEMPLYKFLSLTLDEVDKLSLVEKKLVSEVAILKEKIKLQQDMILALDSRLKNIEEEGNL
jgi:hypothetical protein